MSAFPKQKLSSTEKMAKDKVTGKGWGEQSLDYIIDEGLDDSLAESILSDIRLVDGGDILESDYKYVLNPLNTSVEKYKRFGAKLRNFDIITPVRNLHLGEFSKRFKIVNVVDSNPEDDNNYKKGLTKTLQGYYQQKTINDLAALGISTGAETQEQASLEDTVNEFNRSFDDNRVISGQEILDYIRVDQDLDDKWQDAFNYWLTTGMTCTYKGIFNDDIDVEVVPPWQMRLPKTWGSNFIEDAPFAVRRQIMNGNQIVDRWHKQLADKDIEWLEEVEANNFMGNTGFVQLPTQWIASDDDYAAYGTMSEISGHEVYHAQWKSYKQVGILSYMGVSGEIETIEVDDTYKLNETLGDISIEWDWQSEVWEGWRIGSAHQGIYLDVRPLPYNRMELNNSSKQKLSYNGRLNRGLNGKLVSVPSAGRNYQMIYNILAYQREKTINKNKDKVLLMPQGLIPKGVGGWDEEKHMYYMDANSYAVYDESQPTAGLAVQGIKVLDMSLGAYIKDITSLMQDIKNEWWESVGMNRQRFGDTNSSDGKSVNEQAIFRSSIISEELNRRFEKFQEKDYAGMLDISKVAYIDGKKAKYINSEGREAFIEMNADDAIHRLESDSNVHVVNSSQETENIQQAKEFGFSLGQNADAPSMLELIGSKNFAKTKEIVTKLDAMNKQRADEQAQAERENNANIEESKAATEKAKHDVTKYVADKEYQKAIDVKTMEINNTLPEKESDPKDTTLDNHKIRIDNEELKLKKSKEIQDKKEGNQKIAESKAKIKHMAQKPKTVSN